MTKVKLDKNKLYFLPLGGSGEIGMNLNLYGYNDQWLMVDLGVSFYDRLGIDVMMPNPQFIIENRKQLAGLLLTHAHEDHIGAVPYLWEQLQCPIYATPFTAELVRRKFQERHIDYGDSIHELSLKGHQKIGCFDIELVTLTHSIPEPNGVVIRTPAGSVFHTGDWKIDPAPMIGEPIDADQLKALGDEGVLAMVCDSTNVFHEGEAGSEGEVRENLKSIIGGYKKERVFVTCFASNLARLETVALAAKEAGRRVVLLGRSFGRMVEVARANGYLKEVPEFVDATAAASMPAHKVLYLCSGSQGEPRAALNRIANGAMKNVTIQEGDIVLFSSRVIPGNERSINAIKNKLIRLGVRVITRHDLDLHVSGHPARSELEQMYDWIRPKILVPVHGELQHMVEQGRLGKRHGIPEIVVPENGTIVDLTEGDAGIVEQVPAGRLALDGSSLVTFDHATLKERRLLETNGMICITLVLDRKNQLKDTLLTVKGFVAHSTLLDDLYLAVEEAFHTIPRSGVGEDGTIQGAIQKAVRRLVFHEHNKKPVTIVHCVRG
jgi:ribonuclease J